MSAAARLPDLRRSRLHLPAAVPCCFNGAIVDQASDAPKRFDPGAAPLGDLRYLRSPDGSSRRQVVIPESQRPTSRLGESAASRTSFASDQFPFSGAESRAARWTMAGISPWHSF